MAQDHFNYDETARLLADKVASDLDLEDHLKSFNCAEYQTAREHLCLTMRIQFGVQKKGRRGGFIMIDYRHAFMTRKSTSLLVLPS